MSRWKQFALYQSFSSGSASLSCANQCCGLKATRFTLEVNKSSHLRINTRLFQISLRSPGAFVYNLLHHHFICMVASSQMEVRLLHPLFTCVFLHVWLSLLCTRLLGAVVCALPVPCVCLHRCLCVRRLLSVTGGKLSIISFNYPEHSERPKLTPLLSSGCWKSHAYFTSRRPIVCQSALLLSSDKTRLITVIYLPPSLPPSVSHSLFPLFSPASMLPVCKTKAWIINIHTLHAWVCTEACCPGEKQKHESPVFPSLACLCVCVCAVMCHVCILAATQEAVKT